MATDVKAGLRLNAIRVFLLLLVVDVVLLALGVVKLIATALTLALIFWGAVLLFRGLLRRTRALWSLRNRLVVAYMFMAVVPIALILALVLTATYFVTGQVAAYLVATQLEHRSEALHEPARLLAQAPPQARGPIIEQIAPLLTQQLPNFQVLVTGDTTFRYPPDNKLELPPGEWKEFSGTVVRDGVHYCMALSVRGTTRALLIAPVTIDVLAGLEPGLGAVRLIGSGKTIAINTRERSVTVDGKVATAGVQPGGEVPPAIGSLDFPISWPTPIEAAEWNDPNNHITDLLLVETRMSAVMGHIFGNRLDWGQGIFIAFMGLVIALAAVELIALVIGISITRSITNAVQVLYEGTQKVGAGDFSYRVPVKGSDQLSDLGKSFNEMNTQLENLVAVAKEKERLQSEIEIASEVQNQLFPRSAPPTRTIELTGVCEPARMVSGDYYDYLSLPNGSVALALGDVAGKGISAALLMASIQSIMRTQLATGGAFAAGVGGTSAHAHLSTAGIVAQLNKQLYANTSAAKYATFFFGLYDEHSRLFTYTNAGHLPPLLVSGESVNQLAVTGTVVGAFPSIRYEEQTITLAADDLLIAYTDGITEPENAYGEEFGAERLGELVMRHRNADTKEIAAKVMEAVRHWSNAPELPDDMTVLVARGVA